MFPRFPPPRIWPTYHVMLPAVEVGRSEDSAPIVGVVVVGQRQTSVREKLPRLQEQRFHEDATKISAEQNIQHAINIRMQCDVTDVLLIVHLNSGLLQPHSRVLRLPQVDGPRAAPPVPVVRHHRPGVGRHVGRVVGPDDPHGVRAQGEVPGRVAGVPRPAESDHGVRVVPVPAQEDVVAHGVDDRGSVVLSVPVLHKYIK